MSPSDPETPCFEETEDMMRIKKFASQQQINPYPANVENMVSS